MSSRVRLTKSPRTYLETRQQRRELPYEALLGAGRTTWHTGDRIRVYRKHSDDTGNTAGIVSSSSDEDSAANDPRDYDTEYYVRLLRTTYAQRLVRAFRPEDFDAVFGDPDQISLFTTLVAEIQAVLTTMSEIETVEKPSSDNPAEVHL